MLVVAVWLWRGRDWGVSIVDRTKLHGNGDEEGRACDDDGSSNKGQTRQEKPHSHTQLVLKLLLRVLVVLWVAQEGCTKEATHNHHQQNISLIDINRPLALAVPWLLASPS